MSGMLPTRRDTLATTAAAGAVNLMPAQFAVAAEGDKVRPFKVSVPDDALEDLRRRIKATNWPERETVTDTSQAAFRSLR